MQENKKKVAVTTSMGMTALAVHGTTIHHWARIRDDRYSKKVVKLLNEKTTKKIRETDIVIVDEIGMVLASIFQKLEYDLRKVRLRWCTGSCYYTDFRATITRNPISIEISRPWVDQQNVKILPART